MAPIPSGRKQPRDRSPAPSKALSGQEPTKDNVENRSPEHFALVSLTESQGLLHSSDSSDRTSGCCAVEVLEYCQKDKLLVPLRDTKMLSLLRDTPTPQSWMVKITLELLSWVTQPPGKESCQNKPEDRAAGWEGAGF